MTESEAETPALPTTFCPTCRKAHSAALSPNQFVMVLCDCGKLLKIQRGNGNSLVVAEQAEPILKVEPSSPPV